MLLTGNSQWLLCLVLPLLLRAQVEVIEPERLKGQLDHEISTFGFVDYQATVTMQLYQWGYNEACGYPDDRILELKSPYPKAFLVKRGGCSYRTQATNAHLAGARLLFVYRDDQENIHASPPIATGEKTISLPALVIISKNDGERLKAALQAGNKVVMSVDFEIKKHDPPVFVRFVYSILDRQSLDIMRSLLAFNGGDGNEPGAKPWQSHNLMKILLVPKVLIESETGYDEKDIKKFCVPASNFCAPRHENNNRLANPWQEVVFGAALYCFSKNLIQGSPYDNYNTFSVLLQQLGDMLASNTVIEPDAFWSLFEQKLKDDGSFSTKTRDCIETNIGKSIDRLHMLTRFFEELRGYGQQIAMKLPSMYIENQLVRGDLTDETALSAFCDSLTLVHKPPSCHDLEESLERQAHNSLEVVASVQTMSRGGTVISVFLLTVVLFLLIYFAAKGLLKNRVEKDIRRDIDSSLEKYYQIQKTKMPAISGGDTELTPNNS